VSHATRKIKLCIPIYFDDGIYPSAGVQAEHRNIYWRTVTVLCASINRAKIPELDILICTNETPSPDIFEKLSDYGVSFISPSFSFQPPKGLFPAFSGAFYLFDCLHYCRETFSKDGIFVFMDPDCVVMDNLEIIRKYSDRWSLVGYQLEIDEDHKINGCSRTDLLAFLQAMKDNNVMHPPKYFGGEFLVVSGEALQDTCTAIDNVWKLNIEAFQAGQQTLKTEEHVISVALAFCADRIGTGNAIVKRMWTRPSLRNVSSADRGISIWHLPAEKRFAFQNLFYLVERNPTNLENLSDKEFRDLVAKLIRLEPSPIDKILYFLYPIIKSAFSH
jgi:hypothetical protein